MSWRMSYLLNLSPRRSLKAPRDAPRKLEVEWLEVLKAVVGRGQGVSKQVPA
jgi:hypothetical protein